MVNQPKTKIISKKQWRNRGKINLLIKNNQYYNIETFANLN